MKAAILIVALLAASVSAGRTEAEYRASWASFLAEHNKFYSSDVETSNRFQIFKQNVDFIDAHNAKESTFKVALNKFADMTAEEFGAALLAPKIDATRVERSPASPLLDSVQLPTSLNWAHKGAVTPVKNQGQCGSCWSFSTTGSVEGCTQIATGKLVSLSEENLMSCSRSYGNNGCNGGLMDNAFKYIIANGGIDTEQSWPYEAQVMSCKYSKNQCGATISGFQDVSQGDESALQHAVNKGPVSVAIDASQSSFQFYSSGVYYEPRCSSTQLDHGVLAVGWGVDSGSDYWIVKNSWGTSWGQEGYIWMSRNRNNNCGIATMASYPTGCNTC